MTSKKAHTVRKKEQNIPDVPHDIKTGLHKRDIIIIAWWHGYPLYEHAL